MGLPQSSSKPKWPFQYVLKPMIQLGIPSSSFLTKTDPKWIFVVTQMMEHVIPSDLLLDESRNGAVDTSWCSISAVETITILTAQFDNVNCELSFRSYYQYRMSCPTEYASKYSILSTVCQYVYIYIQYCMAITI